MSLALDPDLAAALAAFPEGLDPADHIGDMNVVRMLRSTADILAATGGSIPTDERVAVEDRTIPGPADAPDLSVRVYTPRALVTPGPGVVFFHGGAFILGDVYTEELRCLRYAADGGCVVVSVGYRLAPEDPFPAATDDGDAALRWSAAHAGELGIDPARLAVAGSSAGGALAAATALRARDHGGPALAFQLLNYPVIDDRLATPSMRSFAAAPLWTSGASALMWDYYLGPAADRGAVSPYAAPGRAEDLAGLPPALVVTAELDPLRDEGLDYGRRLLEAGVPTELHCYTGACHGFDIIAATSPIGRRALDEQAGALARALRAPA